MQRNQPRAAVPDATTRRLFAYLDGELDPAARAALEAEIASSASLAEELRASRALYGALQAIESVDSPPDLEISVIASLRTRPGPLRRLWGWLSGSALGPAPSVFDAVLDGQIGTRQARELEAFVARDPDAARVLAGWRRLGQALARLPGFDPADGFEARVMTRLRTTEAVERPPVPALRRLLDFVVGRDQRLAAASGVAFGPLAAVVGVAYMLFASNPLVTLSDLGTFLVASGRDAFLRIVQLVMDTGAALAPVPRIEGISGAVSTWTLVTMVLLLGGLILASAWILYRHVIAGGTVGTTTREGRHAPV